MPLRALVARDGRDGRPDRTRWQAGVASRARHDGGTWRHLGAGTRRPTAVLRTARHLASCWNLLIASGPLSRRTRFPLRMDADGRRLRRWERSRRPPWSGNPSAGRRGRRPAVSRTAQWVGCVVDGPEGWVLGAPLG